MHEFRKELITNSLDRLENISAKSEVRSKTFSLQNLVQFVQLL